MDYNKTPSDVSTQNITVLGINNGLLDVVIKQANLRSRNIFGAMKGKVDFKEGFDDPLPKNIIDAFYG